MRASVFGTLILTALFVVGVTTTRPKLHGQQPRAAGPAKQTSRPETPVEWAETVESAPYVKKSEARDDALTRAQDRLAVWLRAKYPDLEWTPTAQFIGRNKLIKSETELPHETDPDSKVSNVALVKVKMDLELTSDGLKKVFQEDHRHRVEGRLWVLAKLVGGLVLLLGAVAGCIRLDEWTKGYLTWALRVGAVALVVAGIAALWLA